MYRKQILKAFGFNILIAYIMGAFIHSIMFHIFFHNERSKIEVTKLPSYWC